MARLTAGGRGATRRLVVPLVCAAVIVLSAGTLATMAALKSRSASPIGYKNPVFKKDFADPMVYRQGRHSYFAYATTADWEVGYFPILHSKDLIHWRYIGDMFKHAPSFAQTDLWAPDVVKRGKTFLGYFTLSTTQGHCIGVGTASGPKGPFKARSIVTCGDANGFGYIDPDLFVDSNGKAYMYVAVDSPHIISVVPMKSDLMHPAGPGHPLFGVTQAWESGPGGSTVEGPFMLHAHGQYFLFYSGNSTNTKDYAMGYATSSSPMGPFTKCSCNPVVAHDAMVHGPGGGSVITGPDGKYWMVYHAWSGKSPPGQGGDRTLRVDPLRWNGTNWRVHVTP